MGSNEVWLGTLSLTVLRTLATMGRSTDMACHRTDKKLILRKAKFAACFYIVVLNRAAEQRFAVE